METKTVFILRGGLAKGGECGIFGAMMSIYICKGVGKRWGWALMLALAVGLGAGCGHKEGKFTLDTAVLKRGNLTKKITATGLLSAVTSVDVGSQISGTIQKRFVDFNSVVTNGQVLAQIDPSLYAANVHQAKGDLDNVKAALELADINEKREKRLLEAKLVSQSDYDQTLGTLHQAQATVEIKAALLENAQANLNYCTIYSPIDGIVISRVIDVGQTVAAAFSTPVLFTIANDLTKMNINASISEADVGQVRDGQKCEFAVDAFPDEVFQGTVTQVRKSPATVDNVVTYSTIIDVKNPDYKLFPGMTADIAIVVAQRTNVLRIPNAALRFLPPDGLKVEGIQTNAVIEETAAMLAAQNERTIYLSAGTKEQPAVKAAKIKIGIADGAYTEALEGLHEGDSVVTAAVERDKHNGPP